VARTGSNLAGRPARPNGPARCVAAVIDDWHAAAAASEYGRCRSHFLSHALFFGPGTDDRFAPDELRICPWDFELGPRQISLSPDANVAWFWEALLSAPCLYCVTGVLVRFDNVWKIALLSLSVALDAPPDPRTSESPMPAAGSEPRK
jgi:hypothetical protein